MRCAAISIPFVPSPSLEGVILAKRRLSFHQVHYGSLSCMNSMCTAQGIVKICLYIRPQANHVEDQNERELIRELKENFSPSRAT
jgi:hypothetical protein